MIQRPQTVLLFVNILLLTIFQIYPILDYSMPGERVWYTLYAWSIQVQGLQQYSAPQQSFCWVLGSLVSLITLAMLYMLCQYQNAKYQRRVGGWISYGLIGLLFLLFYLPTQVFMMEQILDKTWKINIGLPFLVIVIHRTALRFIQKDEDLIKSLDRL